jgi:hypothetical protein
MTDIYFQNLTRWNGERINDVLYPRNIAALWSDAELAEIGLYRAYPPEAIPEGKQISGAVEWDGDGVRYVLEDIPPPPRRRVDKWLIAERIEAAGKSDDAYDLLTAPGNRGAFIKWNMPVESVYFDDAETVAMLTALGLDPEVILAL